MNEPIIKTRNALALLVAAVMLSACGTAGSEQQLARANAVHAFDENRAPYGQRIIQAIYLHKPQLYGLNPYFSR